MKEKSSKRAGTNDLPASDEEVVVGDLPPSGLDARGRHSTGREDLAFVSAESIESDEDRMEEELAQIEPAGPSETAQRVRRLQQAVLEAASRRKRLPQPLFWSLFHTELAEIRRTKERKRILSKLLS